MAFRFVIFIFSFTVLFSDFAFAQRLTNFDANHQASFSQYAHTYPNKKVVAYSYPSLSQVEHADKFRKSGDTVIKRKFGYVCGPMALLIAENYFTKKFNKKSNQSYAAIKREIDDVYAKMNSNGSSANKYGSTHVFNILRAAQGRGLRADIYTNQTPSLAVRNMKSALAQGHVVIAFYKQGSKPTQYDSKLSINHATVIYSMTSSSVRYVDPWDGQLKRIKMSDFQNSLYLDDNNDFVAVYR